MPVVIKSPNGNTMEVKNEDSQLVFYFSRNNKYPLYSAGETEYYSKLNFSTSIFKLTMEIHEGFKLERYGGSQFLTKVK